MTLAGRLARGKENVEKNRFLQNSETLEYLESVKKPVAVVETAAQKTAREKNEAKKLAEANKGD